MDGAAAALAGIVMKEYDLRNIGMAGSAIVKTHQKIDVAKDTRATELSIEDHIIESRADYFEDDIGPETEYAPNIEYGRKDMPNYPIQPFVVPSASGANKREALNAVIRAYGEYIKGKWPR